VPLDDSKTRVDGTSTDRANPERRGDPLDPYDEIGTTLGRYVLVERVGAGGMGTVVRAYDPRLHREVALKRVHRGAIGRDAADRMIREAQAMAQLNHPNVVAVYDVELIDEAVVIAMEYVPGATLDAWCRAQARAWQDIVANYLEAGRGLHAAHLASLVHRDFKPSNVLVSESGLVKVMDFGLAKPMGDAEPSESSMLAFMAGHLDPVGLERTLTRADMVVGTPRYMAPEQHIGEVAGPAADQYAFCVALWEALAQRKVFDGESLDALAAAKLRGPGPWPGRAGVPARVGEILARGLAPDLTQRWPDMAALLDALRAVVAGRRGLRWPLLAAGIVGASAAALIVSREATAPCAEAGRRMNESWNDARKAELVAAIERSRDPQASDASTRIVAAFESYVAEWIAGARDACDARHVRQEQSDRVLDLRTACLERRRQELDAAVGQLIVAPGVLASAIDQAYALGRVSTCADIDALQADIAPPEDPELVDAVAAVRARVAAAAARLTAGDADDALAMIGEIEREPATKSYAPLRLEAALVGAKSMARAGRWEDAATSLRATLATALEIGADELAAEAAIALTRLVGGALQRPDEGRLHGEVALALARRQDADGVLEVRASAAQGVVLGTDADFENAETLLRRALQIAERVLGQEHPETAGVLDVHGWVLVSLGRFDEAEQNYVRAIEILTATLGVDHPDTLRARDGLSRAYAGQGRLADTEVEKRRVFVSRERSLGPEHPDTASALGSLASTLGRLGRQDEAVAAYRTAIATVERRLGTEAPLFAELSGNLAVTLLQSDPAEAYRLLRGARGILERTLGASHPTVAATIFNAGKALALQARFAEAEPEYRLALARLLETLPEDHRDIAALRINLSDVLDEQGRYADAEAELRLATASLTKSLGEEHIDTAGARNNLASVLARQGKLDEAELEFRAALTVLQARLPASSPNLAIAHHDLGELLLTRDRVAEALPLLERAVELVEATESPPTTQAELLFGLAKALIREPSTRMRAQSLAQRAADLLVDQTGQPTLTAEIDAFLRTTAPAE
jgi:serine/threonine protein kinase/Tfp pilus assembly protein PilF